jgi:hypothetical protein
MADSHGRDRRAGAKPKRDHYVLLGVKRHASPEQIAEAYRHLAKKYHPDVNPGDSRAERQFLRIQAAFEVLSDPGKRAAYDETNLSFATARKTAAADHPPAAPCAAPRKRRRWQRDPCVADMIGDPAICLLCLAVAGIVLAPFLPCWSAYDSYSTQSSEGLSFDQAAKVSGALQDKLEMMPVLLSIRIGLCLVVIVGAIAMLTMTFHTVAVIASIVVMIPYVGPCCGLGVLIGAWSLARLSDPTVKSGFWL